MVPSAMSEYSDAMRKAKEQINYTIIVFQYIQCSFRLAIGVSACNMK